jgi:hypothetical protein
MTAHTEPPDVPAYTNDRGDLVMWCSFCGDWHSHGGAGGAGHRVGHCYEPGGPYACGYVLVPAGPLTDELRAAREPERRAARRRRERKDRW